MALAVLEEVVARAYFDAQPRTRGLALALAYLASQAPLTRREPFDRFWQTVSGKDMRGRTVMLNHSLEFIYERVGRERDYGLRARLSKKIAAELGCKHPDCYG